MSDTYRDPQISDIVLYWEDPTKEPLPLLITAVQDGGCVSGVIPFIETGWQGRKNVPYGPKESHHWGWKSDYYFNADEPPKSVS